MSKCYFIIYLFLLATCSGYAQAKLSNKNNAKFLQWDISLLKDIEYKSPMRKIADLMSHTYTLHLTKKDQLYVRLKSKGNITFRIYNNVNQIIGMPADVEWFWDGQVLSSGEYRIVVTVGDDLKAGTYDLFIKKY